ncbi:MAG: dihydrodipicolinate synthase family protein, partial [Planctomycetaceae bacterium]|nr:dihydrodipicolinate synthase family protein [Planctomycetaceae bacterium]
MQQLCDKAYAQVIEVASQRMPGRGEVMIGVGDASWPRTRDRIALAQQSDIDYLVILTPAYVKYTQKQLIAYCQTAADYAAKPIFLYDLPQLTGNALDIQTVVELSRHPNIHGIKCSDIWEKTRQIIDLLEDGFRIIPAQPFQIDTMVRLGVESNLDGIFSVFPRCALRVAAAAESGEIRQARRLQAQFSAMLNLLRTLGYSVFNAAAAILNDRGISGRGAALPAAAPDDAQRAALLGEPLVAELQAHEKAS